MGTRNLIAVVYNNEYKIAQYSQWDGYFSGQGRTIINFIKRMNKEKFIEQLKKVRFINELEIQNKWIECGASRNSPFVNIEISNRMKRNHPELSRDTGALILSLIYKGKTHELQNSIEFASDGLFCEYGYVLDMDNNILEIYKGFHKTSPKKGERFSDFPLFPYNGSTQYYPIHLISKIPFDHCKHLTFKEDRKKMREIKRGFIKE